MTGRVTERVKLTVKDNPNDWLALTANYLPLKGGKVTADFELLWSSGLVAKVTWQTLANLQMLLSDKTKVGQSDTKQVTFIQPLGEQEAIPFTIDRVGDRIVEIQIGDLVLADVESISDIMAMLSMVMQSFREKCSKARGS